MDEKQIIPTSQVLPPKLNILPIAGTPVFPGIFTPLMVVGEREVELVEHIMTEHGFVGLVLTTTGDVENPAGEDLYKVGTVAKVVRKVNLPDGGINIFISTLKRFRIKKFIFKEHPITVAVEYLEDKNFESNEVRALTRSLISEMKQISENNPLFSEQMRLNMVNIDHPGKIADFITSILNIDRKDQQNILETLDVHDRMMKVLVFIRKEQELMSIQQKIMKQINEKISTSQREYFLKEQLKAIKQELGMPVDSKSGEYQRFKETIDKLDLDGDIRGQVEQELEKFNLMDTNSSEFMVTRNYLDTITSLPWNAPSVKEVDMQRARRILDEDHYGLEDVKERILEYLAVRKLKKDSKGSILCLFGPPGVGKTSVGKSIARALDKSFFRFSVGGMRDEAEIKGHRRTYVGAMPGKIIQGLKIVKTKDPVFMIDEIDKLGVSFQGDPSSALLEVLDSEQNVAFRDHYLDLPFDISDILFITTANTLDTIPAPLLDRMEVIRLSGYINDEKVAIARKYLIPKSLARRVEAKGRELFQGSPVGHRRRVRPGGGAAQLRESPGQDPPEAGPQIRAGTILASDYHRTGPNRRVSGQTDLLRGGDQEDHPTGHDSGVSLDAVGRRHADYRGRSQSRKRGFPAYRTAGERHAGIGEHRLHLCPPYRRRFRSGQGVLREESDTPACTGRRNPQGRSFGGHHHGFLSPVPGNRPEGEEIPGHDRRAVPGRSGASDRRLEGEGDRGQAQQDQTDHHSGAEREGSRGYPGPRQEGDRVSSGSKYGRSDRDVVRLVS
jgi:Lon protease-like protein